MRRNAIVVLAVVAVAVACRQAPPAADGQTSMPEDHAAAVQPDSRPDAEKPPVSREVTVPAGTRLQLVLDTPLASDTSSVEQAVDATLAEPLVVDDAVVFPAGSRVTGRVTEAVQSAKVKGRARLGIRFDAITGPIDDQRYAIATQPVARTAPSTREKDALTIVAPAAGGAVIGRIVGGKKGAAIGTATGGAAGTAMVLSTRGEEVRLAKGTTVTVRLAEPVTVRVPAS